MCSGEKDAHHTVAALCSSRWKMYDNLSWVGWGREQQDVNVFEVVVDKLGTATRHNIECSLLCEGQGQEKSGFDSKFPSFGSKCHLGNLVNHLTHWLFPLIFGRVLRWLVVVSMSWVRHCGSLPQLACGFMWWSSARIQSRRRGQK